jgi:imidazolonepropionase-like amidohydrolase
VTATVLHLSGVVLPEGEHRDVWVRDGRFTFEPVPGAETISRGGWLLPGLVDAHCHIGVAPGGEHVHDLDGLRDQALTERAAGVLALRDCGSPVDTRALDDDPELPRIIRAGRHLARTRRYIPDLAVELEPEDLAAEVRVQARRGDGWVKLVGDWIDRDLGDLSPSWPRGAVEAAIAEAHRLGARVTAHCFAENSLRDLVEAGIDCIEHATGLTDELIPLFASRGVAIVPTLVNIATFPQLADGGADKFPQWAAHMRRLYERRYDTVRNAYDAGIPVYVGTDAGGHLGHGLVAGEVAELVTAGIPPVEALSATAWGAREWLGRPGLDEGAPADLVVYEEDPRADVRVLAAPRRVVVDVHPFA